LYINKKEIKDFFFIYYPAANYSSVHVPVAVVLPEKESRYSRISSCESSDEPPPKELAITSIPVQTIPNTIAIKAMRAIIFAIVFFLFFILFFN
jgi:hypothetical protein